MNITYLSKSRMVAMTGITRYIPHLGLKKGSISASNQITLADDNCLMQGHSQQHNYAQMVIGCGIICVGEKHIRREYLRRNNIHVSFYSEKALTYD